MAETRQLRPYDEWHEDHGDVLWWVFPITEAPYVWSPLNCGFAVASILLNQFGEEIGKMQADVGGWPFEGYEERLLWWEPIVAPADPRPAEEQ